MWLIFICSTAIIALVITMICWIVHKVMNSMIRDNYKLAKELKEDLELNFDKEIENE